MIAGGQEITAFCTNCHLYNFDVAVTENSSPAGQAPWARRRPMVVPSIELSGPATRAGGVDAAVP